MEKFPNVTQKIILRNRKKILILKYEDNTYDFPGGRVKWNEDLFEALKRELKEELNFHLEEHPRLFHVWNHISSSQDRHSVMIYYIYDLNKFGDLVPEGNFEILWLTEEEMRSVVRDQDFVRRMFNWKNPKTPPCLFYAE